MINFFLLLTVIFWGLSFIATKALLAYLSPVEIVAIRLILGTPVLYFVALFKKADFSLRSRDYVLLLAASLILALHFLIQAVGLIYTSATNTAWIVATIPIFIALLARMFLKERMSRLMLGGIALATIGVLLLVSRGNIMSLDWLRSKGDWIVLSSGITWSVYTILTRDFARRYHPLAIAVMILILPTLVLNAYCAATTPLSKILSLPIIMLLALLFLGVFCLGLAHWIWLEGLSRKGATEVGVYIYLEPVVTTIAAIPLLDEKLVPIVLIAAIMITGGVFLVQKKHF